MQNKITKVVLLISVFTINHVRGANATLKLDDVKTSVTVAPVTNNAGLKIGVIDSQLIMTSDITKAAQAELGNLQSELEAEIKAMDADLEKRYKALQSKSKLAEPGVLDKDQEALNDAKNKRDLAAKSAGEKMQRAANKAMEQLGKLVQEAAQLVLQELGLDLILDKSATLAYAKSIDVTDKVIAKAKNLQNKSDKPAAPAVVKK